MSSREGISDEQLSNLDNFETNSLFDETDRMVLRYTAQVTQTPVEVEDELFKQLKGRFSEKQLIELTTTIAMENFRARMNHAFGIGSSGFAEGAACQVTTS